MYPTELRNNVLNFVNSNTAIKKSYETYRDNLVKAHFRKLQIEFLHKCLINCVYLKTIQPKSFKKSYSNKPFLDSVKESIIETIDRLKIEKEILFRNVRHYFTALKESVGYDQYYTNLIQDYRHHINRDKITLQKSRLEAKFNLIFDNSPWMRCSNKQFLFNMSSHTLTHDPKCILDY